MTARWEGTVFEFELLVLSVRVGQGVRWAKYTE
jgi:hypothetical protein